MKMVGPFAASTLLDTATSPYPADALADLGSSVSAWRALERITGLSALLYVLPSGTLVPELPASDVLLPYTVTGQDDTLSYAACDLPPQAQHPTDLLSTAQAALRALMSLHEAGLVHGALGPQALWLIDGEVRLAGAGLPWGERTAPFAAPEGINGTPAADLYALGVTLLRLGPLPEGLAGLLSEYPAQRPSARDTLARLNAGPRLSEKLPLIVDAPRPRLPAEVHSTAEVLPLVADPDYRLPDIGLDDTVLIPDAASRAAQQAQRVPAPVQPTSEPPDDLPQPAPDSSGPRVVKIQVPPAAPVTEQQAEPAPPATEAVPLLDLQLSPAEASPIEAAQVPAALEVPSSPQSDIESLLGQFDLFDAPSPAPAEASQPQPAQQPAPLHPEAPEVTDLTLSRPILPEPQPADLYPPILHPAGETIHIPELEETPPHEIEPHEALKLAEDALIPTNDTAQPPANMVMPAPSGPTPPVSRRQFKPVKMKWDTGDDSWHVKHDENEAASSPQTSAAPPSEAQGLLTSQPVTPTAARTATRPKPKSQTTKSPTAPGFSLSAVPRWFWGAVLAALLMVGLLWGLGKIMSANREVGGTVTPPGMATGTASGACCSLPVQVFSAQGEALSVPVQFILHSGPAASHLQAGQQVSSGGVLHFDAPGHYILSVQAESYHPGQIGVDVPASTPLRVILK